MQPRFQLLDGDLADQIISEAKIVLAEVGIEIVDSLTRDLLAEHGAVENADGRVLFDQGMVEAALDTTPRSFSLFDVLGNETHRFDGRKTHFTPGSAAINVLDRTSGEIRSAQTADLVNLAKLVSRLPTMNAQSTALMSSDVPEAITDSYRLFLNLLYCEKPVVTGAFTIEGLDTMRDLVLAVRGSAEALAENARSPCLPAARQRRCGGRTKAAAISWTAPG